jgi:hypothetical protein
MRYEDYIIEDSDPVAIVRYITKNRGNDRTLIDKYIIGHSNRELQYAITKQNTWKKMFNRPDIDEHILMDRKLTFKYIMGIYNMEKFTKDDITNTGDIVIRAVVLWEKGISIPELYKKSPEAAVYYSIYVIRCRSKYVEVMGMSGPNTNNMDEIYGVLFILGHDIPKNIRELTPGHVDLLYGNEELYFGQEDIPVDIGEWYKNIIDTYGAYIKKYGRSEIIERSIVRYFGKNSYILTYLCITVFGYRLSYALEYIDPNIEDTVINYELYRNIFITKDDTREVVYPYILFYIQVNGSTKFLLDKLISLFSTNNVYEYGNIGDILTVDDLKYIYDNIPVDSEAMFVIYSLIFDTRSKKLEDSFGRLMDEDNGVAKSYQYYWLKFLKGTEVQQFNDMDEELEIYYDNYKGTIPNMEKYYIPPDSYMRSRVKQ